MLVKNMNGGFYIRIDRGEEIVGCIMDFCRTHKIKSGSITGLGSVREAELGLFDTGAMEYIKREFAGIYEIASMTGNISEMNGGLYLHIHAVLSDRECRTYGGHFARGITEATCEVVVIPFKYGVGRKFDGDIGLNLLDME
ncbi:MAG: DNA-binding protein [Clostridia bacterium]|nr:DNA-binding protein [Clostridia bacterium]